MKRVPVTVLLGKTFSSVKEEKDKGRLVFSCENGETYLMQHDQECCETVELYDICGELSDLAGSPILQAEEETESGGCDEYYSRTWTFYKFSTIKGFVTLRWIGESNGYYSQSVELYSSKEEEEE